jgi:hypothetical protein
MEGYMSESEQLIRIEIHEVMEEIEELLLEMIKMQESKSESDPKVLTANQELGSFLNMYKEVLMKIKRTDQEQKIASA